MNIKLSLDTKGYKEKPKGEEIKGINNRLVKNQQCVEIGKLADLVGNKGYSFCPAVFSNQRRRADNFLEMQLFVLDFDGNVSIKEIEERAKEYGLEIAFKYQTFSSTEEVPKFRIVFINDVPVTDRRAAEIMLRMLLKLFHEADQCCKDVSRMFYGGKEVIGEIGEGCINILSLTREFQRFVFEKFPKNYTREIGQFAKKNNIYCINNCLGIGCVREDGTFEDFLTGDLCIYRSVAVFPSNSPAYAIIWGEYQSDVRQSEHADSLNRVNLGDLEKSCRLYCDFLKQPHISHKERFFLLTNMIHMKGGKKRFLSVSEKKGYDRNKWRFYAKYVKDRGYRPQGCDGVCSYADTCEHKTNLVLTLKTGISIIRTEEETYYPIEEVYQNIRNNLNEAIKEKRQGIYLIPAQTAIGKTEAYCNKIRDCEDQKFIVAVPTNKLKWEVAERLRQRQVMDIFVTPSLDEVEIPKELKDEVEWMYQVGLERKVAELLKSFIKRNKNSTISEIIVAVEWCKKYLKMEKELPEKRVVVTTHARLVTLSRCVLKEYQVIVDEDILSTFFKNVKEVSVQAIERALNIKKIPAGLAGRLRQILSTDEGRYERFYGNMDYSCIAPKELKEAGIWEDVNGILLASVFQKEGENVSYFYPQIMQMGKYIILSATAEKNLYQKYFQGWWVKSYSYLKAEYKGSLIQMTAHSMSRYYVYENKDKVMRFINRSYRGYEVITFLKYEEEFGANGLHFGNVEGIDRLKGRDILIIGTPHQNEFIYKLIGKHLGMAVEGDTLAIRRIKSGGYEFNLMTYRGQDLQALQIYFLRKELEQCIGRARLLRYDCKVVVLSNFPCEQAQLIQKEYLENEESENQEGV